MAAHALRPLLVAEDDPNDMFLFTRLLKAAGAIHALHIALDGPEAIRLLTPIVEQSRLVAKPALAFIDVQLPQLSGLEVLAWIRQQPALDDLAVVLLSTSPVAAEIEQAADLGAQCYFVKFPSKLALARLLDSALRFTGRDGRELFDLPGNLVRPARPKPGDHPLSRRREPGIK